MTQSVKKYHYTVDLSNKCDNGISVGNVAHLNGSTYVATTNKNYPLLKFNINKDGGIIGTPTSISAFSKTKIKFIGFIKDKLAIIPKYNWTIRVLDDNNNYKSVTIDSQSNLRHDIVECILNKYPKSCRCEDCYHLMGFVQFHDFNIFVQLSCNHKPDHKLLYIIKAKLNIALLECTNLEATNEYNYYSLFSDQGLSEKYARSSEFTGLHYDGKKVYLISTHGKQGHLWEMPYFNNISYLGPPTFVATLRRQPKGIYSYGSNLIVLCSNIKNQKMNYYMITQ